jgi:uncharacterized membrane protein YfcA
MVILNWSFLELAAALGIVLLGTLIHASIGMGIGLVAVPVLLLVDAVFVPGPILSCALVLATLMILRERRAIDFFGLKWALLGRVFGVAVASFLLVRLPTDAVSITSALMILIAVGLSFAGLELHTEPSRGLMVGVGAISGVMSTLSSVGGPPIALVYQDERGPRLRATLSGYFVLGTIISLIGLATVGGYGVAELKATAVLLPAVLAGYLLSAPLLPFIDRGYTRIAILLVSTASSVVVLVRHLG